MAETSGRRGCELVHKRRRLCRRRRARATTRRPPFGRRRCRLVHGLQAHADGHSCGNWAHYFCCRVLAYAADPTRLGPCTFPAYLSAGLRDLKRLKGGVRADAEKHQRRLATQRRDELQALLRDAARSDSLP